MDRNLARVIAQHLAKVSGAAEAELQLEQHVGQGYLSGFHQWADARPCEGAFLFRDNAGNGLWSLLIDWKENGNFYLVLYPESKSGPIAEIHRVTEDHDEAILHWRYSPSKRDGRNEERKDYFSEAFLSADVQISVPMHTSDVVDFVGELFSLARSRAKADALDPDRPVPRNGFPEGKTKERIHLSRERNPELVRQAKLAALRRDGRLECACCGFDFQTAYGDVGKGFIEAHHTKPISTLHEEGETVHVEDLALVCSNCHRMLHRRRPWLDTDELTTLLKVAT